nr:MAG TPA: hypothetical protein [Caudoviricetes sp.]
MTGSTPRRTPWVRSPKHRTNGWIVSAGNARQWLRP